MKAHEIKKQWLLSHPDELRKKKPFTRCVELISNSPTHMCDVNASYIADAPKFKREIITQEQFMAELDPYSHDVLFDDNIPSIVMKTTSGGYVELKYSKVAVPFQKRIKAKQVLHLTGNKLVFTLIGRNPTEKQRKDFATFKEYWEERNQEGMKNKMVDTQLSYGDAGLLYYFDRWGRIKSRLLSFSDGYVLCSHDDDNGDRLIESVYYVDSESGTEYIDSYDDKYFYRHTRGIDANFDENNGWVLSQPPIEHGFDEIPLVTKRGDVAWNDVQPLITSFENLYNVFLAIQRRHGWGLLYIKGKFKDKAEKIAGSIILNDTSMDGKGDAKFLTPPTPDGTLNTLQDMLNNIQLGSSTTFILPKDIKTGGDISGITIQLVQSMDIENATQKVIDWQNVASKMVRLFKYGLAKELVASGKNPTAITDFENLFIHAKMKVWKPMNEYEYNQMLTILTGAGILSKETGIEKNTESAPDEQMRMNRQEKQEQSNESNVVEGVVESSIQTTNDGEEE